MFRGGSHLLRFAYAQLGYLFLNLIKFLICYKGKSHQIKSEVYEAGEKILREMNTWEQETEKLNKINDEDEENKYYPKKRHSEEEQTLTSIKFSTFEHWYMDDFAHAMKANRKFP
jgi:gamma-glutamylcyclotransferase (GGCT)/AIG2-like uncharacterized protein YtfP